MGQGLYEKIIEQASHLPNLTTFQPMLNGEPFLDKAFIERLKLARAKLPNAEIEIYTNGSLLTDEVIYQLKEITNLRLSVSLNGLKPETRKTVMGLDDYWGVVQAFKLMERLGIKYRATMVAYPEISREEITGFIESGGTAIQYQSWAGIQYPYERRRWTSCARVINQMTVLYTGDVCLCCFDPFGEVNFGNLNVESMEAVWNGSQHKEYQIMHKQGRGQEMAKCCSCTEG
jgi:radical SAM protein with 4Fe4S-binding SPASM domain